MFFIYASLIIALACSVITERTLVGYGNHHWTVKLGVFIIFLSAWLAPLTLGFARRHGWFGDEMYSRFDRIGYMCFGFAFILFVLLFLRDGFWFAGYRIFGKSPAWNPTDVIILGRANIVTVIIAILLTVYAWFQATAQPKVRELELKAGVPQSVRIVQINDLHLNRSKPLVQTRGVIELANSLNPDIIVLPGDIIDDSLGYLAPHLEELSKLKAKYGVYFSAGNHEYYNGFVPSVWQMEQMGFNVLSENGQKIEGLGIYIAGISDNPAARDRKEYPKILTGSKPGDYKILLAHNPRLAKEYLNLGFDLQLSAHTHGGQIFPFHILVKIFNRYLSGKYDIDGKTLYISNGAGYWGPPLRLFAPSDISLITLTPKI
ncbi:MAG: metallophosphoesterase [Alphaproteobacteria bacterium]|nr:metallophosphoesterase [Alphaproteobacteria bacterium]